MMGYRQLDNYCKNLLQNSANERLQIKQKGWLFTIHSQPKINVAYINNAKQLNT